MISPKQRDVRKSQKEHTLLRALSTILIRLQQDIPSLVNISVTRLTLSPDSSEAKIYFYSAFGEEIVKEEIEKLKIYKNSIRYSLAQAVDMRRIPTIRFVYDKVHEKTMYIESLIDSVEK
jgi:ribosome-binding factor A